MSAVFGELQGGGILWQSGDVHLEEVEYELAVDVVELILALAVFFLQVSFVHLFKVGQIVGALQIDAFMDDEVLPVFDLDQRMLAVGAAEVQGREAVAFLGREPGVADFAQELPFLSVVPVEIHKWSLAAGAGAFCRYIAVPTPLYRKDPLTIAFVPVGNQFFIGPVLCVRLYHRKPVYLELLVLGRMGIVEGPLPERDISAENGDKPAILLIKVVT